MDTFKEYLDAIVEPDQRDKIDEILNWTLDNYTELDTRIAWNQPMFTHHDNYIIGFSYSKNHIAMSPEVKPIEKFQDLYRRNRIELYK